MELAPPDGSGRFGSQLSFSTVRILVATDAHGSSISIPGASPRPAGRRVIEVRDIQHDGHAALELVDDRARMVVVHSIGPRIAWFGPIGGANLLYWDTAGEHRRGDWHLYGGHRLWITRPLADEAEETYASDNEPCAVRRVEDGAIVTATSDVARLQRALAIRCRDRSWTIEHRIRNVGDMLWSGGAWALTCTAPRPDTRYRVPLDGGSPHWEVITVVIPRRWGGTHTSRVADPQIELTDDAIDIRPQGVEAKRMVFAPRGTIEMIDRERGTFVKTALSIRGGAYPLGTNLAFYIGPLDFMVELETMSPIVTLAPGERLSHLERWSLEAPR